MSNAPATEIPVVDDPSATPAAEEIFLQQTEPEYTYTPPTDSSATPLSEFVPADEPVVAAPEKDELERLLEDPSGPFALASGTPFEIRQLKMRELLRLLRIITRGATQTMPSLNFDNPDEFVQTFIALVIFSIPEAEDETVDFIQSMVDPVKTGNELADAEKHVALLQELENPDLEDLVTIITVIIATEGRDLAALGKRLRTMLGAARKMGQVPKAMADKMGG